MISHLNLLKNSIAIFTLLIFANLSFSQNQMDPQDYENQCGTTELHEQLRLKVEPISVKGFRNGNSWSLNSSYGPTCDNDCLMTPPPAGMGSTYKLPVVFTISNSSCTNNVPNLTEIDAVLHKMNDFYACQGIPVEFYKSTVWQGAPSTGDHSTRFQNLGCVYNSDNVTDIDSVINIYIFDDTGNGTGCNGFAFLPFNANSERVAVMARRCFINYAYADNSIDCSNPSLGLSVVLIHEMGHYLGLYHTHQGGDECPDGSNACSTGDFIVDTDADPNLGSDCAIRNGGSCTDIDISACPSPCSTDYPDNASSLNIVDNIMSYNNWGSCRSNFTTCQKAKIVDALLCARGPQLCQRNIEEEFTNGNVAHFDICLGDDAPTFMASQNYTWHNGIGDDSNILMQNSSSFTPTIGTNVGQLNNMLPGTYTWYLGDVNEFNSNCRTPISVTVLAQGGTGTSNQQTNVTIMGSSLVNFSTDASILGNNQLIGWWLTQDNPAVNGIINQTTLDNAVMNTTIDGTISGNPVNHIFQSTNGTDFSINLDCNSLDTSKTYYATPVVATSFDGIPTEMCSAMSGNSQSITFNGFPGKYTSINPSDITCAPVNPPHHPNYTITVSISNYSGSTSNHVLLFRDTGYNGTSLKSATINGNGTYIFTEADFPNFDPAKATGSGLTAISWQQGGNGMSNATITMSIDISYLGLDPIVFPSIQYSSCVFGTPVEIHCETVSCQLTITNSMQSTCNDNGTPLNPNDDWFDIIFNASNPSGNDYEVVLNANNDGTGGTVIGTSPFGTPIDVDNNMNFKADNQSIYNLTLRDKDTPTCFQTFNTTKVASCSNTCELTATNIVISPCDDNNTPLDPSDDFYTITTNPTGNNIGSTYAVSSSNINISTVNYGSAQSIGGNLLISAGAFDLTITDNKNGCTIIQNIVPPENCSNNCTITASGLNVDPCNNDGTPMNPDDDTFTLTLNPTGTNLGLTYALSINGNTTANLAYGTQYINKFLIMDGDLDIIITDEANGCTRNESVSAPNSCSDECSLITAGLEVSECNNNETPLDPSDDFYSFSVNPTGINIGNTYSISGDGFNVANLAYGQVQMVGNQLLTSSGIKNIIITDDTNGCTKAVSIVPPASCSSSCSISNAGLNISDCNDNDTPMDPSDDYFTFSINPIGDNLGSNYTVSSSNFTQTFSYGSDQPILGNLLIANGNINITITDIENGCMFNETVMTPQSCSNECELTDLNITTGTCDNNNTPLDPNDDFYSISISPNGTNLGANYSISGTPFETQSGIYDTPTLIENIQISKGAFEVTVTDNEKGCSLVEMVHPPTSCSNDCEFTDLGLIISTCNDNETPHNADDDFYSFTLNPIGNNLGNSYTVSSTNGVISAVGNYGIDKLIADNVLIALGNFTITVSDNTHECSMDIIVEAPEICSDTMTQTMMTPLEKEIQIYPNPTNSIIYFHYSNNENLHFTAYNCTGSRISIVPQTLDFSTSFFDLSQFASGIYFIQIEASNGERIVKRVVLMK